jgi:hypothetical protein
MGDNYELSNESNPLYINYLPPEGSIKTRYWDSIKIKAKLIVICQEYCILHALNKHIRHDIVE